MRISSRKLPPLLPPNAAQPASVVPTAFVQSALSVEQISALLRAHLKQAVIIFLALVVATVIILKAMPKSYTAQATVLVNFESNDGTRAAPPDMYTNYLLTQVALLQNREELLAVIDRLGLTQDPEFAGGFMNDGMSTLRDWVEKNLRGHLAVEQGKGLQLLYVSATSKDRDKAAKIANTLVDVYQARESRNGDDATSGRAHEYSVELTDLRTKVSAAEQRMAEFRQRTGITDIKEQNDVETQALAALEQQLLATQNERRTAESKNTGELGVSDPVMGSPLIQALKTQLSGLQAQLAQSASTLGPNHPKVLELQSQIAATRKALDRETQNFSRSATTTVTSATEREKQLKRALEDQRAKVVKIRQLQDEGQKLQLELESAQTVYKRALDSYDQELFASSSIVSRATTPLAPSKPNKVLLLGIGIVLSLLLSVAGPVGFEILFNRRLHCRDDIEREFGLPVLAEFTSIPSLPRFT